MSEPGEEHSSNQRYDRVHASRARSFSLRRTGLKSGPNLAAWKSRIPPISHEALGHHRSWLQQRANGSTAYPRELRAQADADLERAKALMARIRAAQ